jgi:pimeloyl-ACP methyl ester carboxylesterase
MTHTTMPAAPDGFTHRFATVNGLRFHYVEGGVDGPPTLVLLAGFPESWYAWRKVMPILSQDFRVIAIDLPGQGDSDKPLDGYDTKTVAERLHGLIEHLGLKRYGLVAHDVGAWVAFPYAMMFGGEIEAMALLDAGIPGITLPEMLPSASDRSWKTWHFSFHAVPDLPEILLAGREKVYLEWFFHQKSADPVVYDSETIAEYLRVYTAPGGLRAGLAFYRSTALSARQNRQMVADGKLSMPVLGLSADQGSIPDMAAAIAPFAADIVGETIARCGHFQPEEQPAAVAQTLAHFFER